MTNPQSKKPKEKKLEVDYTKISPDDIAKKFLETPPKPKKKEKQNETK